MILGVPKDFFQSWAVVPAQEDRPPSLYYYQGHYMCNKCGKLVGFPMNGKGVWRWNREGTAVIPANMECPHT